LDRSRARFSFVMHRQAEGKTGQNLVRIVHQYGSELACKVAVPCERQRCPKAHDLLRQRTPFFHW
jgi:hypothetical protein